MWRERAPHRGVQSFFTPPTVSVRTDTWRTAVVFQMEVKMLFTALLLSGLPAGPTAVLNLTADFAPLLVGLWVILGPNRLGLGMACRSDPRHPLGESSGHNDARPSRPLNFYVYASGA